MRISDWSSDVCSSDLNVVADDVDVGDLGDRAFGHLDVDRHAVVRFGRDLGVDADTVVTVRVILPAQFLFDLIEQIATEQLAVGTTEILPRLLELVAADLLVTFELEIGDRRPFLYDRKSVV